MFANLIDKIIADYKADPRNKVFIDEETLLASATEETGDSVSVDDLRKAIKNFLTGEMEGDDYAIYDGAVYACGVAANNCFGNPAKHEDDEDYSVDYELEWLTKDDDSFIATIRPN